MNPLLQFDTNKLFYNKFKHKLVIRNSLTYIFREKKYQESRVVLDHLQHLYEENQPLQLKSHMRITSVSLPDFLECKTLLSLLQNHKEDYKLRVEHPNLNIYSNNLNWLLAITYKIQNCEEIWSPTSSIEKLLQPNIIISKNPTNYPIKLTLGNNGHIDPSFIQWAENNKKLIKIGNGLKEKILNSGYVSGMYFYVRDEKVLNLINLMISSAIVRIDKILCKEDIR